MLEMRPVYTSYEREEYTAPFGIVPEEDKVVICARYPERFVGLAYVALNGETGTVCKLSLIDGYEDEIDLFLLGKAMLNYFDLHGVQYVVYPDLENESEFCKKIGRPSRLSPRFGRRISLESYGIFYPYLPKLKSSDLPAYRSDARLNIRRSRR